MRIRNRIIFFALSFVAISSHVIAQSSTNVAHDINVIKRDTTYIYAETTMSNPDSALLGAKAILEMKVSSWIKSHYPEDSIEACIANAKQHCFELHTRRGQYHRAFVYVNKQNLLTVGNKNDVMVFEINKKDSIAAETKTLDTISEESQIQEENKEPVFVLSDNEKIMQEINSLSELNNFLVKERKAGRLVDYGRFDTMPKDSTCNLFVCDDKNGNVIARFRYQDKTFINLTTKQKDDITNYIHPVWFRLKE